MYDVVVDRFSMAAISHAGAVFACPAEAVEEGDDAETVSSKNNITFNH